VARLPYAELDRAPEAVRALVAALPPLNIFRMLAHAETLLHGFTQLGTAILGRALLDPRLRELAILRVAARSPAAYEWQQHVPIARACGVSDDEIAALELDDAEAGCFEERARALLRLTDDLLAGPRASDATLAAMRRAFSDREVCEAILTIGYYMLVARFLETTGVDLEAANAGASLQVIDRLRR
jgi:4-carboxymuconolactone decarboxylase